MSKMGDQLLRVAGITKTFGGQVALDDVSLDIRAGEVHSLVGSNGSGKSTLIKILSGFHAPDKEPTPEVECMGEPVDIGDLGWRRNLHFIHQDLALVPTLSTVENLAIGRGYLTKRSGRIDWAAERTRTYARLAELGLPLDPDLPVSALSRPEATMVAMVRALDGWVGSQGVLVLDEPTAALSAPEASEVFDAVRSVAGRGAGVLFVSHRFDEVFELADRATVLRDGAVVGTEPIEALDADALVSMMIGGELKDALYETPPPVAGGIALSVRGLSGSRLRDLWFDIQRGEIVGVGGLRGSGREEIAGLLFGAAARSGGEIAVGGEELPPDHSPPDAIRRGLALVPADRINKGGIPKLSARENITLPALEPLAGGARRIDRSAERADVGRWIDRVGLQPPLPERQFDEFSGGNQQKVVIAKALRLAPAVLLLDEPTQGVDVAAKAAIHAILAQAAREGMAILLCSSEVEELVNTCDRVLVLHEGEPVAVATGADLTEGALLSATLGGSVKRQAA